MIQEILIFTGVPFKQRDYQRFGVEILKKRYEVKILDCTAWLRPSYWEQSAHLRYECNGYISIKSVEEFKLIINNIHADTIAIDYLFPCENTELIRQTLKNKKIPRTLVFSSILPAAGKRGIAQIRNIARRWLDAIQVFLTKLQLQIFPKRTPYGVADIAIISANISLSKFRAHAPHKIFAHAFDYDNYLACKNQQIFRKKPYAVLLDQNLVYHPDLKYTGTAPASTEENYYPPINEFFKKFSKITGLDILIAAHPKSQNQTRPNLFGTNEIILNKTAELVKDASIVFAHYSESISFAVIWQKPLVLLTTNDLQGIWIKPFIEKYATLLGAPIININTVTDDEINLNNWKNINIKKYEEFKKTYIKLPDTPELPIWEIFSEYIYKYSNKSGITT